MKFDVKQGLCIRQPWIGKIADGEKTWEMRTQRTNKRGWHALIETGRDDGVNHIVGAFELVDCKGPFTWDELSEYRDKHHVPAEMMEAWDAGRDREFYAWEINRVVKLDEPIEFKIKPGIVTWAQLESPQQFTIDDKTLKAVSIGNERQR